MSSSQFNFKSSGTRRENRKYNKPIRVIRPIGIKTPMSLGDDIFTMNTNAITQLSDNLRNLIMTNYGERLGRYEFGTNLKSLVYEYPISSDFDFIAEKQIIDAAEKFIPQVKIINVETQKIDLNEKHGLNQLGMAKITLRVIYNIPAVNSKNLGLEVDFFIGG